MLWGTQELELQAERLQKSIEGSRQEAARLAAACTAAEERVRQLEAEVAREQQARVGNTFPSPYPILLLI